MMEPSATFTQANLFSTTLRKDGFAAIKSFTNGRNSKKSKDAAWVSILTMLHLLRLAQNKGFGVVRLSTTLQMPWRRNVLPNLKLRMISIENRSKRKLKNNRQPKRNSRIKSQ